MNAPPTSRSSDEASGSALEPEHWVERYGDGLFRYAYVRLRDRAAAEDLVQETLLEAFKSRRTFRGQCSEKSWLFAILRHNLLDAFRRNRVRESETLGSDFQEVEPFEQSGWRKGSWQPGNEPVTWDSPEDDLSRQEFWNVFHRCASKLPPLMSKVLLLREMDDLSTERICQVTGVSGSNLWVLLHRARLALQACLQQNWFK